MKKRIGAFVLSVCMILELIPTSVYAAEGNEQMKYYTNEAISVGDVSGNDVTGGDISENEDVSGNGCISENRGERRELNTTVNNGNIAEGHVDNETECGVDWVINSEGKLIVSGEGNVQVEKGGYKQVPWKEYHEEILAAEVHLKEITNTSNFFMNCWYLQDIDISNLDTSKVTDMSRMFYSCGAHKIDLSTMDTRNVTNMESMFAHSSVEELNLSNFDTSNVTDMGNMFSGCSNLKEINLSSFDTSNVTDMEEMFANCTNITELDLSNFDTHNVTSMFRMFYQNTSSNSKIKKINVSNFDTSNVTDMEGMFQGCEEITELDLSSFNTAKVFSMTDMFMGCSKLTELDISNFNTSQAANMHGLFYGCSKLKRVDLGNFDTSAAVSLAFMFADCNELKELNISSFNTENVHSMAYMFYNCKSIESLDLQNFKTYNVAEMNKMFSGCSNIKSINLESFNTENVTDMSAMFAECSSLSFIDLKNFKTNNVTDMSFMFAECEELKDLDIESFNTEKTTNMQRMFFKCNNLSELDLSNFYIEESTLTSDMFVGANIVKLKTIPNLHYHVDLPWSEMSDDSGSVYEQMPLDVSEGVWLEKSVDEIVYGHVHNNTDTGAYWSIDSKGLLNVWGEGNIYFYENWIAFKEKIITAKVSLTNVTSTSSMFFDCENLVEVDLSELDTSKVTDMSCMFSDCSSLKTLDLSGLDTSAVTDMNCMFIFCSSLKTINLSNFNTSKVTNIRGMFNVCTSLQTVDLHSFDTKNVTDMSAMFALCNSLESVDISNFSVQENTNVDGMFNSCDSLEKVKVMANLTKYIELPYWMYDDMGKGYHSIPKGLKKSIWLEAKSTVNSEKKYTVKFDTNGGNSIPDSVVSKGYAVKQPQLPMKEGYNFAGWYLDEEQYDFKNAVTEDIILTAHWTEYEQLEAPTANLRNHMQVVSGTKIALSNKEKDVTIYYTVDGTDPTRDSSLYEDPIMVDKETTIKAFAIKEGFKDSEVVSYHYTVSEDEDWGEIIPEDIPENGIPEGMWIAGITEMTYTGKAIIPNVRVYDGKKLLTEKVDYTISCRNNVNAADKDSAKAPYIQVTGKGNYEGKATATFTILPVNLNSKDINIVADDLTASYNKKIQPPVPVVMVNGKKLTAKKDFIVSYPDKTEGAYKEPGTYDITLTGCGNYIGTYTVKFTITETISINKATVSAIKGQKYTGYALEPYFTVKCGKETLKAYKDYVVTYSNNVEIGKATILIEGIGKYSGSKKVEFKIEGTAITKAKVTGLQNTVYNGKPQTATPVLTVKNGKEEVILTEGVDYTVTYQNNKNTGTAKVIFTGINGFYGTMKKTFKITPFDLKTDTAEQFKVESGISTAFVKTGATPKPVITFNGTVLTEGKDYTLKYANNKKVAGSGDLKAPTVTITGKGNFKGTRTVTFDIVPQDLSNLSLEAADKVFQNKAKNYTTKFDVLDSNGKKLAVKKDYEIVKYAYADGSEVKDTDIIPAGTEIFVTVKAKEGSGFTGELTGSYRIVQADISKVTAKVTDQTYTGSAITPGKEDITLTMKKVPLTADDYEIVSYSNNVKKGTATVIIRGVGNYGGTKKITFKIKSKKVGFLWW